MMKRKTSLKKTLTLLLALCMTAALLAGCGSSGTAILCAGFRKSALWLRIFRPMRRQTFRP